MKGGEERQVGPKSSQIKMCGGWCVGFFILYFLKIYIVSGITENKK